MSNNQISIDYYSDILCVWAWIAQQRIDELKTCFDEQIKIRALYTDVFGDVEGKIQAQWAERGSYTGYARHVQEAVAEFPELDIRPDIWTETKPKTSANAHMVLKAVETQLGSTPSEQLALCLRKAFFIEAKDISDMATLIDITNECGIDTGIIEKAIHDGSAIAALMADYQRAKNLGIKGSPSYVMNEGRQTLYGNVGYRVLQANVAELIRRPTNEASWC